MDDETKEVVRQKLVTAKADAGVLKAELGRIVQTMYVNPQEAYLTMVKHYRSKGETDLMAALKANPEKFGALRGSFRSPNWKPFSAAHKKLMADAGVELPSKVKASVDADNKVDALERAMFGEDPFPGPDRSRERSRGGPDFR